MAGEWVESAARAGKKHKTFENFGDALDAVSVPIGVTSTDLRKAGRAIIRIAGARHGCNLTGACVHEQHATDMESARDALQAIGLIPTRPNLKRFGDGVRNRVYGRCPGCRRRKPVGLDGVMGAHIIGGATCAGVGEQPLEVTP